MAKPAWLIPKKKPNTSKISTRNVVKKHLKEWNYDKADTKERLKKLKSEIADIQMHHEDYGSELDDALSNVSDWIEED